MHFFTDIGKYELEEEWMCKVNNYKCSTTI